MPRGEAVVTHINDLTYDVLILVFKTVIDIICDDILKNPTTGVQPAITLSHVCQTWRSIILSHPIFWTRMVLVPPWRVDAVVAHLERSHPCPIDVDLKVVANDLPSDTDGLSSSYDVGKMFQGTGRELGRLLMDRGHLSRCRRLSARVDEDFESQIYDFLRPLVLEATPPYRPIVAKIGKKGERVMSKSSYSLPLLQELHLEVDYKEDDPDDDVTVWRVSLGPTPSLTTLKLGMRIPLYPFTTREISRLTTLHINTRNIRIMEFFSCLSECPLLEILVLYGYFRHRDWPTSNPLGSLPSFPLQSLRSLGLLNFPYVSELLLSISAPHLQCLNIAPYHCIDLNWPHPESSIGWKQYHTLPRLRLALNFEASTLPEDRIPEREPYRIAEVFPGVKILTVVGKDRHLLIDALMTTDGTGEPTWPNLHTLAVKSPLDFMTIRKLAAFRKAGGSPLSAIHMARVQENAEVDELRGDLQVIERDSWGEFWETAMYYPNQDFGSSD